MKKYFLLFCLVLAMAGCSNSSGELSANKVYFFYQDSCPHCHHALQYVNSRYPALQMEMMNIATPQARELFIKCAKKFKLGNSLGTPLFCMGDKYLMGWSRRNQTLFDQYARPYVE